MKRMKFLATVGLAVLELGAFSVFGGVDVQAAVPDSYEYVAKLDISAKGWSTYNASNNINLVGSNCEVADGSVVYVLDEATNKKGNLISKVYVPQQDVTCFITTKYLKKIETEEIHEAEEAERAPLVAADNHEEVSKMVESVFMIRPKVREDACLDVKDWDAGPNANCQIWENTGASNQLFRVIRDADGYWKIQSLYSGKFLTASEMNTHYSVANAVFTDASDSANQQFEIIYDESSESFKVKNVGTGYLLYDALGKTDNGTNICMIKDLKGDMSVTQRFEFCSVYVNNDYVYKKQCHSNTCTLASATNMIRKKMEIRGREYSHCTEKAMRKIAWSTNGGLYNSFKYDDLYITHCNISQMTDEEKAEYLKAILLEHPEGVVVYSKYNLPSGKRPHACLLVDYDPASSSDSGSGFLVYDPSSATPDHLIDLEECTLKTKTTKMGAIDILWYIKN